ncbi:MAG: hypothetical protein JWR26_4612 [Pedosphaera sp.]|nr:hypothetical protein [Pedosphaera sp.]
MRTIQKGNADCGLVCIPHVPYPFGQQPELNFPLSRAPGIGFEHAGGAADIGVTGSWLGLSEGVRKEGLSLRA